MHVPSFPLSSRVVGSSTCCYVTDISQRANSDATNLYRLPQISPQFGVRRRVKKVSSIFTLKLGVYEKTIFRVMRSMKYVNHLHLRLSFGFHTELDILLKIESVYLANLHVFSDIKIIWIFIKKGFVPTHIVKLHHHF